MLSELRGWLVCWLAVGLVVGCGEAERPASKGEAGPVPSKAAAVSEPKLDPSEGPPASDVAKAQRETIAALEAMGFVIETNGFEEAVGAVLDERDVPADAGRQLASLETLETVRFWKCGGVDDTLVGQLAGLPELKVLATRAAAVTDAGLAHLARTPTLESLNLGDCRGVTGRGLEKLAGRKTLNEN